MRNGHRITTTADMRCGTCGQPVGTTVVVVPCQCPPDPDTYWPCEHTVAFLRHYPERPDAPRPRG